MAWDKAASAMKGKSEKKPEKKIESVSVRHAANGGHIITHHHTHPDVHPSEEHTTKGDAALMAHMQQSMPDQAPPAEAGAGAGAPDAAAAGAAGAAGAGAPPPAAGAPPVPGM
jgi:hypothetical protein